MRRFAQPYVQVSRESMVRPRLVVRQIHREMVGRGYDGPAPVFGYGWESLFGSLTAAVGDRDWNRRAG